MRRSWSLPIRQRTHSCRRRPGCMSRGRCSCKQRTACMRIRTGPDCKCRKGRPSIPPHRCSCPAPPACTRHAHRPCRPCTCCQSIQPRRLRTACRSSLADMCSCLRARRYMSRGCTQSMVHRWARHSRPHRKCKARQPSPSHSCNCPRCQGRRCHGRRRHRRCSLDQSILARSRCTVDLPMHWRCTSSFRPLPRCTHHGRMLRTPRMKGHSGRAHIGRSWRQPTPPNTRSCPPSRRCMFRGHMQCTVCRWHQSSRPRMHRRQCRPIRGHTSSCRRAQRCMCRAGTPNKEHR